MTFGPKRDLLLAMGRQTAQEKSAPHPDSGREGGNGHENAGKRARETTPGHGAYTRCLQPLYACEFF